MSCHLIEAFTSLRNIIKGASCEFIIIWKPVS